MSDIVYNDIFKQAMEQEKQRAKEQEEAKNNKQNYQRIEYEQAKFKGLNPGAYRIFRVVSLPVGMDGGGTEFTPVLISQHTSDDNKQCNINWKGVWDGGKFIPDPDWILTRLYRKVNEGKFIPYTEKDVNGITIIKEGDKIKHKDTGKNGYFQNYYKDTPSYNRIDSNPQLHGTVKRSFYPLIRYMGNVIDREDTWCRDNKKTKILATTVYTKEYPKEDGSKAIVEFPQDGISYDVYLDLLTETAYVAGGWFNTDVIANRFKSADKWKHKIYDGMSLNKIIDLPEDKKNLVVNGPLTSEELAYEKWNFKEKYRVAPYYKLKTKLGKLFQQADIDTGSKFYDELLVLEADEKKQLAEEKSKTTVPVEKDVPVSQPQVQVQPEVKQEVIKPVVQAVVTPVVTPTIVQESAKVESTPIAPPVARRAPVQALEQPKDDIASYFPKWDALTEEEKQYMKTYIDHIDPVKGVVWKDAQVKADGFAIYPCVDGNCKFPGTKEMTELPSMIFNCPVCGKHFD